MEERRRKRKEKKLRNYGEYGQIEGYGTRKLGNSSNNPVPLYEGEAHYANYGITKRAESGQFQANVLNFMECLKQTKDMYKAAQKYREGHPEASNKYIAILKRAVADKLALSRNVKYLLEEHMDEYSNIIDEEKRRYYEEEGKPDGLLKALGQKEKLFGIGVGKINVNIPNSGQTTNNTLNVSVEENGRISKEDILAKLPPELKSLAGKFIASSKEKYSPEIVDLRIRGSKHKDAYLDRPTGEGMPAPNAYQEFDLEAPSQETPKDE